MPPRRLVLPGLLMVAAALTACRSEKEAATPPAKTSTAAARPVRLGFEPIPYPLVRVFDGQKAYRHVIDLTQLGPRPPAGTGYQKALALVESRLKAAGWTTHRQSFIAPTPIGAISFTNLLARFEPDPATAPDWTQSRPVVIGGHLDSKLVDFRFVSANDGGSSTGIMLELARVLATDPEAAAEVELVFFDGEESFGPSITTSDGLYGSKYYAAELSKRSTWPALGIVLDIVGDPNHALFHNPDTPASFAAAVRKLAPAFDLPHGLSPARGLIIDDHIPLQNTGLPCLHLIGDFMSMDYWHKRDDTIDRVDPGMLGKVGQLTLRFLSEVRIEAQN